MVFITVAPIYHPWRSSSLSLFLRVKVALSPFFNYLGFRRVELGWVPLGISAASLGLALCLRLRLIQTPTPGTGRRNGLVLSCLGSVIGLIVALDKMAPLIGVGWEPSRRRSLKQSWITAGHCSKLPLVVTCCYCSSCSASRPRGFSFRRLRPSFVPKI